MRLVAGIAVLGLMVAVAATAFGVPKLEAGGGGCHEPLTERVTTEIVMSQLCFGPMVARVQPGTTVTWTNREDLTHNVYAPGQSWSNARQLNKGQSVTAAFDKPGVFPYVCSYHPTMIGVVVVSDDTSSASGLEPAAVVKPYPIVPGEAAVGAPLAGSVAQSEGDGGLGMAVAGLAAGASAVGLAVLGLVVARRR